MSFVTTEIQDAVAVLTIDRPKALNALNPEVLADLKAAFEAIDQNTVRCVVLTGAGDKSFVAGADIGSMSTMTKAEGEAFGKLGNDVFLMIEHFPLPVIAAVNGFALGGGNELAMSCDIRLCSDNAVFGQPEVGLGITPGFGGTQRLARLVGMGMAKQLVYSALNIKADEALRIGLVNAVYTQEELMPAALKLAGKIAKNAPIAVRNCKKAINDGISLPIEKAVEVEEKLFGDCFETHDQVAVSAQVLFQASGDSSHAAVDLSLIQLALGNQLGIASGDLVLAALGPLLLDVTQSNGVALDLCESLCNTLAHSASANNAYLHSSYLQFKIKDNR